MASGLSRASRLLHRRRGALIFYAHRVAADDECFLQGLSPQYLSAQLEYLTRHHEILSLSELVQRFEDRKPIPERCAVLTFDDGFKDNLDDALPILQRYRVPATIFLVTGSVSSGELPWPQRIGCILQRTTKTEVCHAVLGGLRIPITSPARRRLAHKALKSAMESLGRSARERVIDDLARTLEVEPVRGRMLTWQDVREMRVVGMEFGAHTFSHPFSARIPLDEARWEMERSREDLKEHLGIDHPPFCFPAGSMNPQLVSLARELGFRSCFERDRRRRFNTLVNADPFRLCRVGLPNGPAVVLEAEIDGPFHAIRRLYR